MKPEPAKKLWLYFIPAMSAYLLMLAVTLPRLHGFSGGMRVLDVVPFYGEAYIAALFARLGGAGRAYYLYRQLPLDMVYVLLYGFAYRRILRSFACRAGRPKLRRAAVLPVAAALFDAGENVSVGLMLAAFPALPPAAVAAAPVFSLLKTVFVVLYLSAFLILGIMAWRRRAAG